MKKHVFVKSILLLSCCLTLTLSVLFGVRAYSEVATATVDNEDIFTVAGKTLTSGEVEEILNGFTAKSATLNLGVADDVGCKREIILQQTFTDGDNKSMIVYNFAESDYFVVDNEFYATYVDGDYFRRLGAPVNGKGSYSVGGVTKNATIARKTYIAQIFETGVILNDNGTIKAYCGAVEKSDDAYVVHPVIDDQDILEKTAGGYEYFGNIDGQMHPLKDADFFTVGSGSDKTYELYVNYSSLCAHIVYNADYTIKSQDIYPLRNYFKNGEVYEKSLLPDCCYSVTDMILDEPAVESNAYSYYKKYQKSGNEAALKKLFEDAYIDMLNDDFVPGYRCSRIKMWDLLVLDLRFGDGTAGFDDVGTGERERMTCLVYNPVQNKVYPVHSAYFLIFKEDGATGRNALGYPESGIKKDATIGGAEYEEIQIFQNGYIYKKDGNYRVEVGYYYDGTSNAFVAIPAPATPDRYGSELTRATADGVVYINYEKGAVKCVPSANKSKYIYTYYAGRYFDFNANYTVKTYEIGTLLTYSQLVSKGAMPLDASRNEISFADVIQPKIYAKYAELYEKGFICGFVEEEFKGSWNNVYAQQFVAGDSTSMIFGEERPFVSALVYNKNTDAVYLMRDDVIKTWQAHYTVAGSPTSDEYQIEGYDYWFQTFEFGMTIRIGNLIVFTEDYTSPENYIDYVKNNPLDYPTHNNKQSDGYIG